MKADDLKIGLALIGTFLIGIGYGKYFGNTIKDIVVIFGTLLCLVGLSIHYIKNFWRRFGIEYETKALKPEVVK